MKKKVLSFLLIFSLMFGIVGVFNVDTTYAASKKIHLKKTTVSIVAGETYQQKLIDKNGKTIKATAVKWKSLKTSVAKINKKGKITAVNAGTAKMTAKYKGKTFKFTVKVKEKIIPTPDPSPSPTPTPTPTPSPTHNSYIGVSASSLTLRVGETKRVTVTTDLGFPVSANNGANVNLQWGSWASGTCTLDVAGIYAGNTVITIYDSVDRNVKAEINVQVLGGLQALHNYVDEKGYVNGNGDKTVKYNYNSDVSCYIINHNDSIEFSYYNDDKKTDYEALCSLNMIMKLPESSTTNPEILFVINTSSGGGGYLEAYSTIYVASYYGDNSTVYFNVTNTSLPSSADIQGLCNSHLKMAMAMWEANLFTNFKMTLSDIGFVNYKLAE